MEQIEQNTPPDKGSEGISRPKKLLYIIFTFIIIIALGIGAYFYFFASGKNTNQSTDATDDENQSAGANNTKAVNYSVTINKTVGDADRDGLLDTEESMLGTDPQKTDTDSDGLSDYEEVKVYKTDPLKADTDSDGHLDGMEVSSGYDPLGPGKLLDLNEEINNLNANQ